MRWLFLEWKWIIWSSSNSGWQVPNSISIRARDNSSRMQFGCIIYICSININEQGRMPKPVPLIQLEGWAEDSGVNVSWSWCYAAWTARAKPKTKTHQHSSAQKHPRSSSILSTEPTWNKGVQWLNLAETTLCKSLHLSRRCPLTVYALDSPNFTHLRLF